jgi:pimeloyl-ACP methyl ester carboxylesterase
LQGFSSARRTLPLLAVLALAGCGSDKPPAATPPAGTFKAAGATMHLRCSGRGAPPVVLSAGLGVEAGATWARLLPLLGRSQMVCTYDRPGTGLSPPGPRPRDAAQMATELDGLLTAAKVPSPRVYVGASFGGLIVQLQASRHPKTAAGVVLVDSLHPDLDRAIEPILGKAGAAARRRALASSSERASYADLLRSDQQVRAASSFPAVPLVVLEHGISFDPGGKPVPRVERLWTRLQRELAARSPQGTLVVARRSHHRIAEEQPELVARAIRQATPANINGGH